MSEQPTEKTDYFDYLDELRLSGLCNMWEAPLHLRAEFNISQKESFRVFTEWAQDKKRHTKNL